MLDKIFPQPVTNQYRGLKISKWFLVLLTMITIARSLAHILLPDGGAQSIASIPLDTYTPGGGAAVIHLFAEWGLEQLLFGILYVIVLWRYQSLIPLMYLFIFVEYLGRLFLAFAKPLETVHTPPGAIGNYVMIPLALIMLGLSLWPIAKAEPQQNS